MANYILLQRMQLTQSAASVTFSNIPQTGYTDLKLVISARTDNNAGQPWAGLRMAFNGSTSNFTFLPLYGNGSSASTGSGANAEPGIASSNNATSNVFGNSECYIPNYTSSVYKSFLSDGLQENLNATALTALNANLWSNTAAITSLTITSQNSWNFVANSTFSLYGIAATGTTPTTPKAIGGDIVVNDGTYWYHAFLSSGTFTPSQSLSCDYLVVAGGGAGGYKIGGGGGAGGFRASTGNALTATAYPVTVGAGGTAVTFYTGQGSNSSINSYTSTGGGYGATGDTGNSAGAGGSGGGGSHQTGGQTGGAGNTPSVSPSQGNNGGTGYAGGGPLAFPGGGGGAGSVGGNGSASNVSGSGGSGTSTYNAINVSTWLSATGTGVSGVLAGGGGGGCNNANGSPGSGTAGGGNGGGTSAATSATANTGSGGGGSNNTSPFVCGAGGSGIVIVRYTVA